MSSWDNVFNSSIGTFLSELTAGTLKPFVLPENVSDLSREELASLVAQTANHYGRMAYFSGVAQAIARGTKGSYDRAYKQARIGNNDAERDAKAMETCADKHREMVDAEAVASVAEGLEHAARVASESVRKVYDRTYAGWVAQGRESQGAFHEQSFEPSW